MFSDVFCCSFVCSRSGGKCFVSVWPFEAAFKVACTYKRTVSKPRMAERKEERRKSRRDLQSGAEPKLVGDFPTEVKDWVFRRVRLNSDVTGIIPLQPLYLSVPLP